MLKFLILIPLLFSCATKLPKQWSAETLKEDCPSSQVCVIGYGDNRVQSRTKARELVLKTIGATEGQDSNISISSDDYPIKIHEGRYNEELEKHETFAFLDKDIFFDKVRERRSEIYDLTAKPAILVNFSLSEALRTVRMAKESDRLKKILEKNDEDVEHGSPSRILLKKARKKIKESLILVDIKGDSKRIKSGVEAALLKIGARVTDTMSKNVTHTVRGEVTEVKIPINVKGFVRYQFEVYLRAVNAKNESTGHLHLGATSSKTSRVSANLDAVSKIAKKIDERIIQLHLD